MIRNKNIVHSFLLCLLIGSTTVYHTPINARHTAQHFTFIALLCAVFYVIGYQQSHGQGYNAGYKDAVLKFTDQKQTYQKENK